MKKAVINNSIQLINAANITKVNNDSLFAADSFNNNYYVVGSHYPYFQHITWIDGNGEQVYRWTTKPFYPDSINVSDRNYFQAVKNNNLLKWENGEQYFLTGISSWTANEKLVIISTPFVKKDSLKNAQNLIMVTLSAAFRSLFQPVLPHDMGFCMINESGDVIFHLDPKRNLNENLLEESEDNTSLKLLLQTRSSGFVGAHYSGTTQRFYVRPVKNMPYYIVTYRDMKLIWSDDLDVISVCSILSLMNLAVILLAILIMQVSGYKDTILYSQSILFTWLRPKQSLKNAYYLVCLIYLVSMILQTLSFLLYRGNDPLCLVGNTFFYSYLLISCAYYQFAFSNKSEGQKKFQSKKSLFVLVLFYLFSFILFILNLKSQAWWFIIFQLLLVLSYILISKTIGSKSFTTIKKNRAFLNFKKKTGIDWLASQNFRWWYTLSVFSFIAATAIMPLVIFYFLSYKEERLLVLKRNQLEFVNQAIRKPELAFIASGNEQIGYNYPYYYNSFADSIRKIPDPLIGDTIPNGFDQLYKHIKPSFSSFSRELDFLSNNINLNKEKFWIESHDQNKVQLYFKVNNVSPDLDSNWGLIVYSTIDNNTDNKITKEWILLLLLFGVLLLLLWGF
ncbi:MAG TPA: cache domain-containing protein, partial [Flavisolibacter sp.]|nr:cache domain-containing protein [Flavisolibacter sp.]